MPKASVIVLACLLVDFLRRYRTSLHEIAAPNGSRSVLINIFMISIWIQYNTCRVHRGRLSEWDVRMRILVVSGDNSLTNTGDAAMLMAAVERLFVLWPKASIEVITTHPDRLTNCCPGTKPLLMSYPVLWLWLRKAYQRAYRFEGSRFPALVEAVIRRRWPTHFKRSLLSAVSRADVVVHSGAGIFNDEFLPGALWRLDILQRVRWTR